MRKNAFLFAFFLDFSIISWREILFSTFFLYRGSLRIIGIFSGVFREKYMYRRVFVKDWKCGEVA